MIVIMWIGVDGWILRADGRVGPCCWGSAGTACSGVAQFLDL